MGELSSYCESPNTCLNNVCVTLVKEGEACSELDICEIPLSCQQGLCRKTVGSGEKCDNTTIFCEDGFICQGGTCLKNYGSCETNTDCNADSYCCVMDSCQTKNVCFPYGEGPAATVTSYLIHSVHLLQSLDVQANIIFGRVFPRICLPG